MTSSAATAESLIEALPVVLEKDMKIKYKFLRGV